MNLAGCLGFGRMLNYSRPACQAIAPNEIRLAAPRQNYRLEQRQHSGDIPFTSSIIRRTAVYGLHQSIELHLPGTNFSLPFRVTPFIHGTATEWK